MPPEDKNTSPDWLTPAEAAARLGVHPRTVSVWAREGHLRAYTTPGGHRRFRAEDVDVLLRPHPAAS